MGAVVSSDLYVDDVVLALAGVREDQTGEIVRSRAIQLLPRLGRRVRAELRGDDVRVCWDRDRLSTWYPAPLLVHIHTAFDRGQPV